MLYALVQKVTPIGENARFFTFFDFFLSKKKKVTLLISYRVDGRGKGGKPYTQM